MTKRQENKLTMYEGLLTLLQANSAKGASITGYNDAVTQFSSLLAELMEKSVEVESVSVGKTAAKSDAGDALIGALLPVCSALYVYGRKQNSEEIRGRVSATEARLHTMRDTELASYGNSIVELATANAAGIGPMGITADKIADLKTKADAYTTAIGAKESSVADRKGARGTLDDLFNQIDELLNEEFDRYMELLRSSDTEFYNKYFAARVIKDMGVRHKANAPAPGTPAPAAVPAKG